jgi:hypothetical protein
MAANEISGSVDRPLEEAAIGRKPIDRLGVSPGEKITNQMQTRAIRSGSLAALQGAPSSANPASDRSPSNESSQAAGLHFGYASANEPSGRAAAPSAPPPPSYQTLSGYPVSADQIISLAQKEHNPESALLIISDGYKRTRSESIKSELLADQRTHEIFNNLIVSLAKRSGENDDSWAENVFFRFKMIIVTIDYDPAVKRALLSQALEDTALDQVITQAFSRDEFSRLVRATLSPEEQKAFDDPETQKNFNSKKLSSDDRLALHRLALYAQIVHYPGERVIKTLGRLADEDWFYDVELEEKQRFAKIFAELSHHDGDPETVKNTLNYPFDKNVMVRWAELEVNGHSSSVLGRIDLDRGLVPAGNHKLTAEWALGIARRTLAHEVSHLISNGDGDFTHEVVALCVGFKSDHKVCNQQDGYKIILELIGGRSEFSEAFNEKDSSESKHIAQVMAKLMGKDLIGKDPKTVTADDIIAFAKRVQEGRTLLSADKPLHLETLEGDDLNFDNHF